MRTCHTILMALFLWSAGQAQTPWTNWGIYRDSTGNGANSVSGGLVCADDTLWLVVDTNGMGAAGITGYRWRFRGLTPQLVYCPGTGTGTGCPPSLPDWFPSDGVANERKLGIKPNFPGPDPWTFMLVVYLSNGDSLVSAKAYQVKGGSASLRVPAAGCAGSSVPAHVNVTGILDSFVVTYGTTTVRNQTDFSINLPSGTGTLDVSLTYYACGTSFTSNISIDYYASAPSGSSPVVSFPDCPNASRQFNAFLPPGYTSFVWKVDGNSVDPSSTNHPLTYSWIPPGPGTYTISYEATYPCGTVSGSTSHTVSPAPQPTWSFLRVFPDNDYCPWGTPISVRAFANASGGTYTIDIGNDGTIEAFSSSYSTMLGALPPGGLPIRVRFDNGCGGVLDTTFTYNPTSLAEPGSYTGYASISIIRWPICSGDQIEVELYVSGFPEDSIKNIQWQIIDGLNNVVVPWTSPSNSRRIQLTVPGTPPWTLECQFAANSPASCVNPPTSPVTQTISPSSVFFYLAQIGSVCLSGGSVRLTPFGNTSDIDSVQYILPNGTIIMRAVGETLTVNVPAGNYAYPIIYRGKRTTCGYVLENDYTIRAQQTPPAISAFLGPHSACSGSPVRISASFFSITSPDSIVAILWNNSRVPLNRSLPGFASTSVSAPTASGIYPIQVIAYSCAGSDTTLLTLQVFNGNTAVADFTAPVSACVGVPVTFQRTGPNDGISTTPSWSFGDGGSLQDTAMSITHTYTQPGLYTVRLSLNSWQCGYTYYQRTIRVYGAPPTLSGLNVTPSGATISYSVSASDYDVIVWDFGDGITATGVLSGTHTYASSGSYTVKVEAINACDTTRLSQTVSVTTGLVAKGNDGWLIYPNPASQEVFVAHPTYQGEVRVELYDVTGRLVQAEVLSTRAGRMQLRVPAGLYTLRLINREGVATTKLLVE
jgi:PKD repeat protein